MSSIKAIIFDLGGVILNLDQEKTFRSFARLGLDLETVNSSCPVFTDFETGKVSPALFRETLKKNAKTFISDEAIDAAWNAMLLDIPEERFAILNELKNDYKLYLLSNTNIIHIESFNQYMEKEHSNTDWLMCFDDVYYSYNIGLRKPDVACYEHVLKQIGLTASECVFIDDSAANLRGAEAAGLRTLHARDPLDQKLLLSLKQMIAADQKKSSL